MSPETPTFQSGNGAAVIPCRVQRGARCAGIVSETGVPWSHLTWPFCAESVHLAGDTGFAHVHRRSWSLGMGRPACACPRSLPKTQDAGSGALRLARFGWDEVFRSRILHAGRGMPGGPARRSDVRRPRGPAARGQAARPDTFFRSIWWFIYKAGVQHFPLVPREEAALAGECDISSRSRVPALRGVLVVIAPSSYF